MEFTITEEEKNRLVFTLEGEDHSFCNILRKELWNDKDITVASYVVDHPLLGTPEFIVETKKGSPKDAVKGAVDRAHKQVNAFSKAFAKL